MSAESKAPEKCSEASDTPDSEDKDAYLGTLDGNPSRDFVPTLLLATDGGRQSLPHRVSLSGEGISQGHDQKPANEPSALPIKEIPLQFRLMAFSFILLFSTGAAFAESTVGPLKSTLLRELKMNNTQFSTVSTASNVVNTVLPLIGGIAMDYVGGVYAALVAAIFTVIGSIITACSANTSNIGLLIGGRVILGFGSIVIETVQTKLYAHWFAGSHLGMAIAVDLAWNACTYMIGRLAAVPMSQLNGWYGWALWIPSFVCIACLCIVLGYWVFERSLGKAYAPDNGANVRKDFQFSKMLFGIKHVMRLPSFYWILAGTHLFQNSARTVYAANLADIQERTRGTSTLAAGYNSSLQSVVTIVLNPLLGAFFDRYGWRMPFVSLGAACYMTVFALIGLTKVDPVGPIILSSFALSFNILPWIGSIPLVVIDQNLIGTAYGVFSSFIACNNIIMEIATGSMQDRTPGQSYDRVIYFLIAVKAFQFCMGPILDYLDGRLLGHTLRKNEKARLQLLEDTQKRGETLPGWRVTRPTLYIFGGQLILMVLTSWILYLCFTVGGLQR